MIVEILGSAINTDHIYSITKIEATHSNDEFLESKRHRINGELVLIESGFYFNINLNHGDSIRLKMENYQYDNDLFFIDHYPKSIDIHKEKTPEDLLKVQNFIKGDLERMRNTLLEYWTIEKYNYCAGYPHNTFKIPKIYYTNNLRVEEKKVPKILSEI